MGARGDVRHRQPVDGVKRRCVAGIDARRDRGSVRAQPPVLDQKQLVAVDGDGLALGDDQGQSAGGPCRAVAEEAEVAQEGAGMTQWNR